ncbi:FAD-dependent monooxygenase [Bartonella sp. DGB1]|uniref:FAD-dependent monooxygenase n=1 Tax=Bartonella sp. DGB1 TaxID=3239807 RepID=UPI003525823B
MDVIPSLTTNKHIVISGAGIAGLTTAILLSELDTTIDIYEQAKNLSPIGAGIQLPPNSMKILSYIGLENQIKQNAIRANQLKIYDAINGKNYINLPLSNKNDYYLIDRATLQTILLNKVRSLPNVNLFFGQKINNFKIDNSKIHININNKIIKPDLLLACDGVWSNARKFFLPNEEAYFTGDNVWRAYSKNQQFIHKDLTDNISCNDIVIALAKKQHLILYPTNKNKDINLVLVVKDKISSAKQWNITSKAKDFLSHINDWHKDFKKIFTDNLEWKKYPLYIMKNANYYGRYNCLLLGDAAHTIYPFAAQGAAMALEDACYLFTSFKKFGINQIAIDHFIKARLPRINKIQNRSLFNKKIYNANFLLKLGRNIAFKYRKPQSFINDLNWIYDYDATKLSD